MCAAFKMPVVTTCSKTSSVPGADWIRLSTQRILKSQERTREETAVHLSSKPSYRRSHASRLQSGNPAAPKSDCLPLLPSGPGGVRRLLLRRTQLSMPLDVRRCAASAPRRGIQPRCSGLRVQGTASSPSSTTVDSVLNWSVLSRTGKGRTDRVPAGSCRKLVYWARRNG